jgi:hypothetical protein
MDKQARGANWPPFLLQSLADYSEKKSDYMTGSRNGMTGMLLCKTGLEGNLPKHLMGDGAKIYRTLG